MRRESRQQMFEGEMEQVMPKTREVEEVICVFLPDHFLYRGVERTVVHFLGSVGVKKNKTQKINHRLSA